MITSQKSHCRIRPGGNSRCGVFPTHSNPFSSTTLVVVVIAYLSTLPPQVRAQDEEVAAPVPTVDPHRLTVEVATDSTETVCSFETPEGEDPANYTYLWLDPALNPVETNDTTARIYYDPDTGTLTLTNAELNDTGDYTCVVLNYPADCGGGSDDFGVWGCANGTMAYKVYVMPDYTTDGIIIGVINGVLLVIFVACLIRSYVVDRRRLRKYGQKL